MKSLRHVHTQLQHHTRALQPSIHSDHRKNTQETLAAVSSSQVNMIYTTCLGRQSIRDTPTF